MANNLTPKQQAKLRAAKQTVRQDNRKAAVRGRPKGASKAAARRVGAGTAKRVIKDVKRMPGRVALAPEYKQPIKRTLGVKAMKSDRHALQVINRLSS